MIATKIYFARRKALILLAVICACVVGVAFRVGAVAATQTDSAAPEPVPELSQSTIQRMADSGIQLTPADGMTSQHQSDLFTSLVSRVDEEFAFVQGVDATEMSQALLTIVGLGPELERDPTKPSNIEPLFKDRNVLAVLYADVELPLLNAPPKLSEPSTYTADVIVFLDPATGEVLMAQSI